MSWAAILPAIVARLATLDDLTPIVEDGNTIARVESGEPTQVQATPYAYVLFNGSTPVSKGQVVGQQYEAMIRVLVPWEDDADSEATLAPFVDRIPDAFDPKGRDAQGHPLGSLGGICNVAQIMAITSGEQGGFHTVRDVVYRAVDFTLRCTKK